MSVLERAHPLYNQKQTEEGTITVTRCIKDFYALEALALEMNKVVASKHSVQRLKLDVKNVRKEYNEVLALMLKDYLILAGIREARHAPDNCTKAELLINPTQNTYEDKYLTVNSWHPFVAQTESESHIVQLLIRLFNDYSWKSDFGGEKWGNAMEVIGAYYDYNNAVFIDTVFNTMHNNSFIVNKPILFQKSLGIEHILNQKVNLTPNAAIALGLDIRIQELVLRYNNILGKDIEVQKEEIHFDYEYMPLQWKGDKIWEIFETEENEE